MAKQVNVFLENRPGRVAAVTGILSENGVNIRAVTIQDRTDFGLMKVIVDRPQEAHRLLAERGFACSLKEVLAMRMEDRPGGLHRLAEALGRHGINVLDGYGFVVEPGATAVWCVEVESLPRIREVVEKEGLEVLGDAELYAL